MLHQRYRLHHLLLANLLPLSVFQTLHTLRLQRHRLHNGNYFFAHILQYFLNYSCLKIRSIVEIKAIVNIHSTPVFWITFLFAIHRHITDTLYHVFCAKYCDILGYLLEHIFFAGTIKYRIPITFK